jgi:hypothetical protein
MALERVWPKDVYVRQVSTLAGKLYTQVIKATGTRVSIRVAGTLPFDKDNNLVGQGSMRLQVRARRFQPLQDRPKAEKAAVIENAGSPELPARP